MIPHHHKTLANTFLITQEIFESNKPGCLIHLNLPSIYMKLFYFSSKSITMFPRAIPANIHFLYKSVTYVRSGIPNKIYDKILGRRNVWTITQVRAELKFYSSALCNIFQIL